VTAGRTGGQTDERLDSSWNARSITKRRRTKSTRHLPISLTKFVTNFTAQCTYSQSYWQM